MTTINVKRRTSTAWIWWVIGLVALVLLLAWAFGAWDRTRVEPGVERTTPGVERTVPGGNVP